MPSEVKYKKLSEEALRKELELISSAPNISRPSHSHIEKEITSETSDARKEVDSEKPDVSGTDEITQAPSSEFHNKSGYGGDEIDNTPSPLGKYTPLAFESPVELLSMFYSSINSGREKLYPWQIETLRGLANAKSNLHHPHKFALCACNGSGKDWVVVTGWAVWFACCKVRSSCIITSASGVQLSSQTENYIRSLCQTMNEFFTEQFGGPIFKINQRFIKCLITGSEIRLFATDEEGKAEGYHPLEPGADFCIIVNEAKTVEPEIFRALKRCTGYNYWLNVSTPGPPIGDFHYSFIHWRNKRHVDRHDCANHLSLEEFESDKLELGEHSALFRSKHLALFTSLETSTIIPSEVVERVRMLTRDGLLTHKFKTWKLRVGIDLAAGGDENSLTSVLGNRIVNRLHFRENDTTVTAKRIDHYLSQILNLPKDHEHLYIDDGGVGRGITDMLADIGWTLIRVRNQSAAKNKKLYLNKGAENWYRVKRIIEENCFMLDIDDVKFYEQLANRYFKQQGTQGRITLQSKADAKAHGHPSPDRADSFILALTGLTVSDYLDGAPEDDEEKIKKQRTRIQASPQAITEWNEKKKYDEYEGIMAKVGSGKKFTGSINSLINNRRN